MDKKGKEKFVAAVFRGNQVKKTKKNNKKKHTSVAQAGRNINSDEASQHHVAIIHELRNEVEDQDARAATIQPESRTHERLKTILVRDQPSARTLEDRWTVGKRSKTELRREIQRIVSGEEPTTEIDQDEDADATERLSNRTRNTIANEQGRLKTEGKAGVIETERTTMTEENTAVENINNSDRSNLISMCSMDLLSCNLY